MNKPIICLLFGMIFLNSISFCQEYIDKLSLSFDYKTSSNIKNANSSLSESDVKLSANFPIKLKQSHMMYLRGGYQFKRLEHNLYNEDKLNLHGFELGLGWLNNWKKNPYWASYIEVNGSVGTNFNAFNKNHLGGNTSVLFYYGKQSELIFSFGGYFSVSPSSYFGTPLIGIDWNHQQKLFVSVLLPDYVHIGYQPNQRIYFGLQLQSEYFAATVANELGEFESYLVFVDNQFPYVPLKAYAFLDIILKDDLYFFIRPGINFSRSIQHYDSFGRKKLDSAYYNRYQPVFSIETGIALRTAQLSSIKKRKQVKKNF